MPGGYSFEPESESGAPPNLYNMGGLNPHGNKNGSKSALFENWCGLDWLTLTLWVNWGWNWSTDAAKEKNWVGEGSVPVDGRETGIELREILERRHNEAMERKEAIPVPELDGAKIHPGGGKIAKKYCRFKLELESAVILIADQASYNGDWPNVKVEISGLHCLTYHGGAPEAYRDTMQFIENVLGASIHKERVGRADLCADFPGWSMDEFIECGQSRFYTCRSRLYHPYLKPGGTSLYWGSGAVILRIYDKLGEMRESALRGAPAKYEHMIEKRWGGVEPESAVRVEYQLRRDALKAFGITDFNSLMHSHADLLAYLVGQPGAKLETWDKARGQFKLQHDARWFRLLKDRPDNKHPERNKTRPIWEAVQAVFCDRFMCPEVLVEIKPENSNIETLLKQAFGVLETAAANRGYSIPGKDTTAPVKYRFKDYNGFARWIEIMLRSVALGKEGWSFPEREREQDSIDLELEEIRLANWIPNPAIVEENRLINAIEADYEAELIGA